MENVQVNFQLEMDEEIYKDSPWNTREGFFSQLVVSYIGSDINIIKRMLTNKDGSDQKKYQSFIKTYEELQSSVKSSIKYELVDTTENMETVSVSFNYSYYKNSIRTKEEIVLFDIFNKNIQASDLLAREMPRMAAGAEPDKIKSAVTMYSHISSMLTKAKETIKINGVPVMVETNTNKIKI